MHSCLFAYEQLQRSDKILGESMQIHICYMKRRPPIAVEAVG